jgi:hypothetical protein
MSVPQAGLLRPGIRYVFDLSGEIAHRAQIGIGHYCGCEQTGVTWADRMEGILPFSSSALEAHADQALIDFSRAVRYGLWLCGIYQDRTTT